METGSTWVRQFAQANGKAEGVQSCGDVLFVVQPLGNLNTSAAFLIGATIGEEG